MSTKRKLPRATLEQKIRILDYYRNSDGPQLDTVDKFKNEVAISTSTFNEWVKHEAEYRERYRHLADFEKNAKRKSKYKYDKINRAMDALVQQMMQKNETITEPVLRGYWQIYAHQFGVDNPKRLCGFSHGWLTQFKKRHGLLRQKAVAKTNEEILALKEASSFQPQQNLSFDYYYVDPKKQAKGVAEIDGFFSSADTFFAAHRYDYPQTIKAYHKFKQAFLSERLIDMRSNEELKLRRMRGDMEMQIPNEPLPLEGPELAAGMAQPMLKPREYPDEYRQWNPQRKLWEQNRAMLS